MEFLVSIKPGQIAADESTETYRSIVADSGISVEETSFKLKEMHILNTQCFPEDIVGQLRRHYTVEALKFWYKVNVTYIHEIGINNVATNKFGFPVVTVGKSPV